MWSFTYQNENERERKYIASTSSVVDDEKVKQHIEWKMRWSWLLSRRVPLACIIRVFLRRFAEASFVVGNAVGNTCAVYSTLYCTAVDS